MKLNDAVLSRRSIRAFLPDPVPREKIIKILEIARWAPSWGNIQPWEIVVADGEKTKLLAEAFVDESKKGISLRPDINMPVDYPAIHKERYVSLGRTLFTEMGIAREDKQARIEHYLNMYRFFGAPAVIYLTIDGGLNEPYACLDIGSIGTTICYAAVQEGLGTIYLAASMHYPYIAKKSFIYLKQRKLLSALPLERPIQKHRQAFSGVNESLWKKLCVLPINPLRPLFHESYETIEEFFRNNNHYSHVILYCYERFGW